jgi:hypothetical protein
MALRVFLSHVHENRALVDRLREDLAAGGVLPITDRDISPGEDWRLAIQRFIRGWTL